MAWLMTFADLVTLLLTFFVLLLSMATMDRSVLKDIAVSLVGAEGLAISKGAGKVEARFEMVKKLLENPASKYIDLKRLKDLLFPDEVLPEGMTRSFLDQSIEVLVRPEGIALVLSNDLLFATGETELDPKRKKLLRGFADLLAGMPAPVNIAGYTDNVPSMPKDNYTLSVERAMSVLSYFLEFGFDPSRFSVSAYGDSFPIDDNATPKGRARNRRVEILLKTGGNMYL